MPQPSQNFPEVPFPSWENRVEVKEFQYPSPQEKSKTWISSQWIV
jgi:hypothetical protein